MIESRVPATFAAYPDALYVQAQVLHWSAGCDLSVLQSLPIATTSNDLSNNTLITVHEKYFLSFLEFIFHILKRRQIIALKKNSPNALKPPDFRGHVIKMRMAKPWQMDCPNSFKTII